MTDKNEQDATFCVSKLKMLADVMRLSVLRALMDKSRNVSELMTLLNVEQSLLSHHLSALREAGLVVSHRSGKAMMYELAPGVSIPTADKTINLGCCQLAFNNLYQLH